MNNNKLIAAGIIATGCFAGLPSIGAARDADIVDLGKLDCRTYLTMDGDERGNTAIFLHGYVSAKKSETQIKISDLATASENIVNDCIDNPNLQLMGMFEKHRK